MKIALVGALVTEENKAALRNVGIDVVINSRSVEELVGNFSGRDFASLDKILVLGMALTVKAFEPGESLSMLQNTLNAYSAKCLVYIAVLDKGLFDLFAKEGFVVYDGLTVDLVEKLTLGWVASRSLDKDFAKVDSKTFEVRVEPVSVAQATEVVSSSAFSPKTEEVSRQEIEAAKSETMATVVVEEIAPSEKLKVNSVPEQPRVRSVDTEKYHKVNSKVVGVIGAVPKSGASFVAMNFAYQLGLIGQRVAFTANPHNDKSLLLYVDFPKDVPSQPVSTVRDGNLLWTYWNGEKHSDKVSAILKAVDESKLMDTLIVDLGSELDVVNDRLMNYIDELWVVVSPDLDHLSELEKPLQTVKGLVEKYKGKAGIIMNKMDAFKMTKADEIVGNWAVDCLIDMLPIFTPSLVSKSQFNHELLSKLTESRTECKSFFSEMVNYWRAK